jgi:hypothetical protein
MADAQMASTITPVDGFPMWDFNVVGQDVPYIEGIEEEAQAAEIACFTQRGLVPQLPYVGPDWLSFFMSKITFGDLDAMVQDALTTAAVRNFFPDYSVLNDKLTLTLKRRT